MQAPRTTIQACVARQCSWRFEIMRMSAVWRSTTKTRPLHKDRTQRAGRMIGTELAARHAHHRTGEYISAYSHSTVKPTGKASGVMRTRAWMRPPMMRPEVLVRLETMVRS